MEHNKNQYGDHHEKPYSGGYRVEKFENSCENCSPNASCKNAGYSGMQCVCKKGFEGDGKTCAKKEETCQKCDENAKCFKRGFPPTLTCKCNAGFTGDGFSCKPKDLCGSLSINILVRNLFNYF